MIEVTAEALATHSFLRDMSRDHLAVLAQAASQVTFPARYRLFEDGGGASRFWLIRLGTVALDLQVPGQGRMKIDTVRRLARVVAKRLQATRYRLITTSSQTASAFRPEEMS
jgi:hypothetical protein